MAFKEESMNKSLIAKDIVLSPIIDLSSPLKCQVKIRSAQEPKEAVIEKINDKIKVEFSELQNPIAVGQSAVFYDNDTVLGGGIIESVD